MAPPYLERRSGQDRRKSISNPCKLVSFTDIYESILNSTDLVVPELLELERLLQRKINIVMALEEQSMNRRRFHSGVNRSVS